LPLIHSRHREVVTECAFCASLHGNMDKEIPCKYSPRGSRPSLTWDRGKPRGFTPPTPPRHTGPYLAVRLVKCSPFLPIEAAPENQSRHSAERPGRARRGSSSRDHVRSLLRPSPRVFGKPFYQTRQILIICVCDRLPEIGVETIRHPKLGFYILLLPNGISVAVRISWITSNGSSSISSACNLFLPHMVWINMPEKRQKKGPPNRRDPLSKTIISMATEAEEDSSTP